MLALNVVFLGVILMSVLCLLRFNVFLSLLVSGLFIGVVDAYKTLPSHASLMQTYEILSKGLVLAMQSMISGMAGSLQTAVSYVLLGAVASAIAHTNLTGFLVRLVSNNISKKRFLLVFFLAFIACFSQNLVPIHVAFVPLLIPPLLKLFNALKIDRRAVACALTFGLTTPYMVLPLGFGLIFQNILKDNITQNGLKISLADVSSSMSYAAICMLAGLFLSVGVFYARKKTYIDNELDTNDLSNISMGRREWGVLIGLIITLILQITTKNLPLAGLIGFLCMIILGGVEYKKLDEVFDGGVKIMGYIAFVMLMASGYGALLKSSGGINELIQIVVPLLKGSPFLAIIGMLGVGLLITMGIGSSFGTIPIIAAFFVPICMGLGMSTPAIIFIIGVAGVLGDTGSPASETTLGVSVGLCADKQANHIHDVCIPTFLFYNGSLLIGGSLIAYYLI